MNTSHSRILVPIDYSDDSRVAAATAFRLAAPEGDVALVHVSPRPAADVVDEVCARAVDWPADMIVVGTHCEPGSVRFLLGSVTAELSRRAPCPVLVTRSGPDRGPRGRYRNVLVAIDYSPVSARAAELAASLVAAGGVVTLLHVWSSASPALVMPFTGDRQRVAIDRLERLAEGIDFPRGTIVDALVDVGCPATRILAQAERMKADLVVLGAHARTGLVENVIGTVADRVLRHAHGPVLLVPR